ncbi:zinc-dependent peptidase [Flammeovirga yaeyamensis]|uniref:Zinc-dependent peptidase n=1 Tax=Flammeovirga yaeyamensis TaxID=367791 RepID=A0AAX1N648_9BACT|nr:zinc-dependent peptidase [Flammeovirga yaeyamensis]MBB3697548.1 hypothetical protein [Flammeovirga yaeyamensis]NMF36242.1 peptidase [Flammeovirga yaeyamensis]QWG02971.1 zinc-dependent peptidase [Flammeovirga yaeyamensis]
MNTSLISFIVFLGLIVLVTWVIIFNTKKKKSRQKNLFKRRVFKEEWRTILRENVTFYNEISEEKKDEFEQRLLRFLAFVKIKGVKTDIEDLDKLLVASSAIIPIFGYPDWEYPNLKEVLIFNSDLNETEFGHHFNDGHVLGMVGTGKLTNKMLLSKGALREGFRNDNDKKNVGIHEFVHLIDMADGNTDGIPEVFMSKCYTLPWINLMKAEIEKIHQNESDLDEYGGTKDQEFITVASEYFFERPQLLKKKHPDLYLALEKIFNQKMVDQERSYLSSITKEKEIGRNDPCPCGSGKKYKKCHMMFD